MTHPTAPEYFAYVTTVNAIYDSTGGDWSNNATEYCSGMIHSGKLYARKDAKVAMVFTDSVEFDIDRMLESNADFKSDGNEQACFRTLEKTKNWLSQSN